MSWQQTVVVTIFVTGIIIVLIFITIFLIGKLPQSDSFCDYDSCSQEIEYWNFNGSSCFESYNPDCQQFLELWNACQHYKNRLGVC